jgi:hypothetical protein
MERKGEFAVIEYVDGRGRWPIAILLLDTAADRLYVSRSLKIPALNVQDVDVVQSYLHELASEAKLESGNKLLRALEDRLSNSLQITDPMSVRVTDIESTLTELYARHVALLR